MFLLETTVNHSFKSILYFGDNSTSSTSRHRADSLKRLGAELSVVNPLEILGPRHRWQVFFDYRTGYKLLQRRLLACLQNHDWIWSLKPDLIWIDSGELFGPLLLRAFAINFSCPIILYNIDDPLGRRDFRRFAMLRQALPFYSICVFIRHETSLEALALGAPRVLTVHRSFDEIHHAPVCQYALENSYKSVISFVGTLIPGEARDIFLLRLLEAGLPLRLFGDRWVRSPVWPSLQSIYKGAGLSGVAYSEALADAAATLGFLSHQNRDLVTTRSFETTACGGLLCGERTSEHQLLYEDWDEAVFWESIDECILHCQTLLNYPYSRNKICINGTRRVRELGVGNEDICSQVLASLDQSC